MCESKRYISKFWSFQSCNFPNIDLKENSAKSHLHYIGIYGWIEGICEENALTVYVTHLTFIEGKLSEAVGMFIFLLITQTHRNLPTGLQEQVLVWADFKTGNSTWAAKGIVLSLGLHGGDSAGLQRARGVAGIPSGDDQFTSENETHPDAPWSSRSGEQMAPCGKCPEDNQLPLQYKGN